MVRKDRMVRTVLRRVMGRSAMGVYTYTGVESVREHNAVADMKL